MKFISAKPANPGLFPLIESSLTFFLSGKSNLDPYAGHGEGLVPHQKNFIQRSKLALRTSTRPFFRCVKKQALIKKIISELAKELELYIKAANAARFEATHEQSKAENKYDTRGLEASYLARGQSKQAAEIVQSIQEFEGLSARTFDADDPIDLCALVELESKGEKTLYFIGPRAGGTEVIHEKKEILVITPQSPLGAQLVGKQQGDLLKLTLPGSQNKYKVVSVR